MSISITSIPDVADAQQILSDEALAFIQKLHEKFAGTRDELLAARSVRRKEFSDAKGIDFPSCDEPDYWDFAYFAFTLGMTFQTSDVQIPSRRVRKAALGQCMAAFVFNIGVLAFTINVLGSS